nr:hypothetical protein [Tanacetum cinerariifolium]
MTNKSFSEYTRIKAKDFKDTLLKHMSSVKKSIVKRARHKRQYDRRVNETQMQMQEGEVNRGKALDDDLIVLKSSRTESEKHDTSSKSRNDTHAEDADINTVNDKEPMAEIIMANPLLNHGVNLPNDEQAQLEPVLALLGFVPAVLDIPNNNNGWIEEEPEEDPKMEEEEEEEEEEEMDIEDEMDDLEIIDPYEIKEGELPHPLADSDTSSDFKPEVKAEDEDEDEATVGTITHAPYSVQPFLGTTYVGS